jgi:hypothetical protein
MQANSAEKEGAAGASQASSIVPVESAHKMYVHAITCDLGLDCTCRGAAMTTTIKIRLTAERVALLADAFATYIHQQIAEEPDVSEERRAMIDRLAALFQGRAGRLFAAGTFTLTPEEARECAEALDAHLYWEVSEEEDRDSGYVYYSNADLTPDSKMWRDDRDPEYVRACRKIERLSSRFVHLANSVSV